MTIDEFSRRLEEEFDEVKLNSIKPDQKLKDALNWSSINALIIMALITSEYGVVVSSNELISCDTVNDLYNLVVSKMS